ncbi:MAG: prepilin peptidase [Planctomycetaceae bacterium]|nr:prepilin peptidase [Planctomycetaceae bacterium]
MAMLVPISACLFAMWHDVRTREIPDSVPLVLSLAAVAATWTGWIHGAWLPLVAGGVLGFLVVLPFTLSGGIGGGDLKLVAALGLWLGPPVLFQTLFWTALAGLGCAVIAKVRKQKDFAYVPAITVGLLVAVVFPSLLPGLIAELRLIL